MQYMKTIFLFFTLSVFFLGCTGKPEIIEEKCSSCHSSSVVYKKKHTPEEWNGIIFGMKARGLKISPEEEKAIKDVLVKNYGTR
jgi:DnaJ-class molecular chaperone